MNILITGNLSSLAIPLTEALVKRKNRIVLASDDADKLGITFKSTIVRSMDPATSIFRDAMSSYGFDIIFFLSTREEQLTSEGDFKAGHQLDGLENALELARHENLKHFFYISSSEVYGISQDLSESASPEPSSANGYMLLTGEQYCRMYQERFDVKTTIVRLTNIYGPDEKNGLLYTLLMASNGKVILPAQESDEISLLHTSDVVDFFIRAIDEEYSPESQVVNLSSSSPIKYTELKELLEKHLPDVTFIFSDEPKTYTRPAEGGIARGIYNWIDEHRVDAELENLVETFRSKPAPHSSVLEKITRRLSDYPNILKWVELILGAALAQFLSQMTGTLIQFKYVDFRLLFVVIMGSIYGIQTGLFASIIISLTILYTWVQLGFDWALLIYNVGNWLPFALYFAAGLITGYTHDKTENQILTAEKETAIIYDKYAFLYGVFNDIRNLKDEFRERLIGYRDSFGRIFMIARELDQLEEQAVFLRALSILEEYMDNKSIAIYSLDANRTHARLEAKSASPSEDLAKSLKLSDFPELVPFIDQGMIFQNTNLLPHYPAYVVPLSNNSYPFDVPAVVIIIWSVKFEQYSTYYYNQLKIICGLVQASLIRATLFTSANYDRMYIPGTRILNNEAFMDALRIRTELRKNKLSDFQLLAVLNNSDKDIQDINSLISKGIRTADIIGVGDDGNYYVLLPQADRAAAQGIIDRLASLGIDCQPADRSQLVLD